MALSAQARSYATLALICAAVFGGLQVLRWQQSESQGQVLRGSVKAGDIVMLSSETCIYCARARAWMSEQHIPFRECMIERDAACLAEYQARGGKGTPTLLVRGRTVLGFDRPRIAEILSRSPGPG